MTTLFAQSPNNDGFAARLIAVEQALQNRATLVTSSLEVSSKKSLNFLCRWALRPLFALFGVDTLGSYRVSAVAKSLLEYCQVNVSFMDDANKNRVVTLMEALNAKTHAKYETIVALSIASVNTLGQQAPATDTPAPAESPILATALLRAGETLKGIASNVGHDVHALLAEHQASFAFSTSGLMDLFAVLLQGTQGADHHDIRSALGIETIPNLHAAHAVQATRAQLKGVSQGVCQVMGYATDEAFELPDAAKTACGLELCVKAGRTSARNVANARIVKNADPGFKEFLPSKATNTLVHALSLKAVLPVNVDPSAAITKDFTFSNGTKVPAKLLTLSLNAKVFPGKDFTLLEIPYTDGFSKVIVLPNEGQDFSRTLLTPDALADYRKQAVEKAVILHMPALNPDQKVDMHAYLNSKKIVPEKFFDTQLSGIVTGVHFEELPAAAAVAIDGQAPSTEYCVDRSFYWYVMQNNLTVIQGQVDSADGLKNEAAKKGYFW